MTGETVRVDGGLMPASAARRRRKSSLKIVDLRATTVTVPLEAPLRHANGAHWGRFVRTIVEVDTDEGLSGWGEMGGGGETAEAAIEGLSPTSRATIRCSSSSCAGRS